VGVGFIAALGTLFYAGAAIVQVCIMKWEAGSTSAQIATLIARADTIAGSMNQMVADNKKALEDNRNAIGKALEQNRVALDSNTAHAKAALDASIEASRMEQRAWLTIRQITLVKEPSEGENIEALASLYNVGKTPAKMRDKYHIAVGKGDAEPDWPSWDAVPYGDQRPGIVSPNAPMTIEITYDDPPVQQIRRYRTAGGTIDIRIRVDYEDVFGESHFIETCAIHRFGSPVGNWIGCKGGDRMDDQEPSPSAR